MVKQGDCTVVLPTIDRQFDMVFGGLWENPSNEQLQLIVRETIRIARKVIVIVSVEQITMCRLAVMFDDAGFPVQIDTWVKNQNSHPRGMKAPLDSTQFVLRVKKPGVDWHRMQMPIGKGYDRFETQNGKTTGNDITPKLKSIHNENKGTREFRDFFGGQAPRKSLTDDQPSQPEWLPMKYMAEWTEPHDSVLDFCCGSGTTLTGAMRLYRECEGYDLDETKVKQANDALATLKRGSLYAEMQNIIALTAEGYQKMCEWARKTSKPRKPKADAAVASS